MSDIDVDYIGTFPPHALFLHKQFPNHVYTYTIYVYMYVCMLCAAPLCFPAEFSSGVVCRNSRIYTRALLCLCSRGEFLCARARYVYTYIIKMEFVKLSGAQGGLGRERERERERESVCNGDIRWCARAVFALCIRLYTIRFSRKQRFFNMQMIDFARLILYMCVCVFRILSEFLSIYRYDDGDSSMFLFKRWL